MGRQDIVGQWHSADVGQLGRRTVWRRFLQDLPCSHWLWREHMVGCAHVVETRHGVRGNLCCNLPAQQQSLQSMQSIACMHAASQLQQQSMSYLSPCLHCEMFPCRQ